MKRSDPFVLDLCKKHQVYIEYDEPRMLSSGIYSKKFYDMEKLYQDMRDYAQIALKLFYVAEESANVVAGCGKGGIPLATIMATANGLKLTMTEKHPKGNYDAMQIGGYKPRRDDKVLLVDDVLTTGGTFRNMKRDVEATGAQVVEMAAILNRNEFGVEDIDGTPVRYLVRAEDLTSK